MAGDLNVVTLVGRMTRDGELAYVGGGTPVLKVSIAVNRRRKVGDKWEDEVHFFDCEYWGKAAESIHQYTTKGKQVGIQGELRQDRWTDTDGKNRSRVKVHVNVFQLFGGGSGSGKPSTGKPQDESEQSPSDYDSYPSNKERFNDDVPF